MRTADGRIKVLDFGLARFASEVRRRDEGNENTMGPSDKADLDQSITSAGCILGTADYIAPEQLADPHAADIPADIYSLGCTLFFLLHSRPPTSEETIVHTIPTGDSPGLDRILNRMLSANPAQRYQTPTEAADALAPFTGEETPLQDSDPPPQTSAAAAGRRSRKWLWLMLAVLLFGGGATAAVYRISTDKGEIIIETDDPKVEVVILQGGKKVAIVDGETKRKIELRSGEYELTLDGDAGELRLSTKTFTLKRGEKKIVTVRHEPSGGTPMGWSTPPTTRRNLDQERIRLPQFERAPKKYENRIIAPRLEAK